MGAAVWFEIGKLRRLVNVRVGVFGMYTDWQVTGTGLEILLWVPNVEPASVNSGKRLRSATGLDLDDTF